MTVLHHALEVTLTRPLSPQALHRVSRRLPLAAHHDATRLMALVPARNPHRAAHRLRRRIGHRLPVDVITTHYPDADHHVLLNIAFPPATRAALEDSACRAHQRPERFIELALHRALAQRTDRETDRVDWQVQRLLGTTTPACLLTAVGHALTQRPGRSAP
ncbi:hypothetical protein ACFYWU_41435 [Streptomyces chrestomyceticus]|uniref:hypothetical protein n=1 Tax=Streptomyces chrestomyceticus TaxID=68185 RepID=UPI0036A312AD